MLKKKVKKVKKVKKIKKIKKVKKNLEKKIKNSKIKKVITASLISNNLFSVACFFIFLISTFSSGM